MTRPAWQSSRRAQQRLGALQPLGEKVEPGSSPRRQIVVLHCDDHHCGESRSAFSLVIENLRAQVGGMSERKGGLAPLELHTVSDPRRLDTQSQRLILLLSCGSLAGIRSAYLRLKYVPQAPPPCIGSVIVGAPDIQAARRCYRRLALGAMRFLNVPLLNLGYLSAAGEDGADALAQLADQLCVLAEHSPPQAAQIFAKR